MIKLKELLMEANDEARKVTSELIKLKQQLDRALYKQETELNKHIFTSTVLDDRYIKPVVDKIRILFDRYEFTIGGKTTIFHVMQDRWDGIDIQVSTKGAPILSMPKPIKLDDIIRLFKSGHYVITRKK